MRLLFDIETNGLLDTVSKVHIIVAQDLDTGETLEWLEGNSKEGVEYLLQASELVGHNIMAYDIPVLEKIYNVKFNTTLFDTMVVSKLIWADRKERDFRLYEDRKIPGNIIGSHSLESWGIRMGILKGEYPQKFKEMMGDAYRDGMEWEEINDLMIEYCRQDVVVTRALYDKIMALNYPKDPIDLEHEIHSICLKQTANGFPFDMDKASKLYGTLTQRRHELREELVKSFWPTVVPYKGKPRTGNVVDQEYLLANNLWEATHENFKWFKLLDFNPSSRHDIADRLMKKYGWKPKEFTETNDPKVDEAVLSKLKYPEAKLLCEFLMVQKRIGQLSEGKEGWLSLVGSDGRVHGKVNTMGAVTSRCTHQNPNMAQVPSSGAPYGHECRELFHAPKGWKVLGCDVSGLELRCLSHFMAAYDGGVYGKELLEGDIHTANQKAAGLPDRASAKTFIYAFLYGAGDLKIGSIVGKGKAAGKTLKAEFLAKTPALKKLRDAVTKAAAKGYISGLDKRRMPIRSEHAALNTLLQGAGAIICKRWVVTFHKLLQERGYVEGRDYQQVAFVHDELQVLVREDIADEIGQICLEAIRLAGEYYDLRIRLDGEYKVGNNWAETH